MTLADVVARDGMDCWLCHAAVDFALKMPHPQSPTLDHVLALVRGGRHELANVRLAHLACNTRRGARVAS